MKKKMIINLFILAAFVFSCSSNEIQTNNSKRNDLNKMNLKGKVKSLKETSYKACILFGDIQKCERERMDWNNLLYSISCYIDSYIIFNSKGYKIEENHYTSKGSLDNKETFNYDENGNKIEENNYISDGLLFCKWINKFNLKGKIIESNFYYLDGSLGGKNIFNYNEIENQIEESSYKSNGNLEWKHTAMFDTKGNQINFIGYKPDGSLDWKDTYKYDKKGNLIEENSFESDGSLKWKKTYIYNLIGNKIEADSFHPDGSLSWKFTYKYDNSEKIIEVISIDLSNIDSKEKVVFNYNCSNNGKEDYDKFGNWLKLIYYKNEIPQYIIEREIEYY